MRNQEVYALESANSPLAFTVAPTPYNREHLRTKKERMGHLLTQV